MATPIFIICAPENTSSEDFYSILQSTQSKMPDYHILVYVSKKTDFEFQVFYEKDFTDINYEELKKLISDNLKTNKQT